MGFYSDRVLPYIINAAMTTQAVKEERRRCLAPLAGEVLEIGFGSGLNLPFYPSTVTKVVGIDPSTAAARLARKRIESAPFPIEFRDLMAEKLPFADGSVETILSTFTMCTIPDVVSALREMRRVLRPDGRLHFVEHGRAVDPAVERWQMRLNEIQRRLFGGCNLNRPIARLVEEAGFRIERLENAYMRGAPRFAGYLYRGVAY